MTKPIADPANFNKYQAIRYARRAEKRHLRVNKKRRVISIRTYGALTDIARTLHWPRQKILNIFNGRVHCKLSEAYRLSRALKMNLEEFYVFFLQWRRAHPKTGRAAWKDFTERKNIMAPKYDLPEPVKAGLPSDKLKRKRTPRHPFAALPKVKRKPYRKPRFDRKDT